MTSINKNQLPNYIDIKIKLEQVSLFPEYALKIFITL